jgi:hypothetical protein
MTVTLALFAGAALADAESFASKEEVAKVQEALAAANCKLEGDVDEAVEKEASGIFEVDDAECAFGPFDIKLDKEFRIQTMTRD